MAPYSNIFSSGFSKSQKQHYCKKINLRVEANVTVICLDFYYSYSFKSSSLSLDELESLPNIIFIIYFR